MDKIKNIKGYGVPINKELYESIKKDIYKKHPKHSLFRSALIQKEYIDKGGKYRGDNKKGLKNWFREKWVSLNDFLRGDIVECGNSDTMGKYNEYPLCRPLAIAKKLSKGQIKKMIDKKNILKSNQLRTEDVLGTAEFNVGKIGSNI